MGNVGLITAINSSALVTPKVSFFFSLTKLPLAEAIAISFIAPLIALYFAHILLGETIRRSAIFASILGFVGTIIIVGGKVGQGEFDRDTALGLASLMFSAFKPPDST